MYLLEQEVTLKIIIMLIALCAFASSAFSQEAKCPDNTVEISRETISNADEETTRLHCRRIDKLTSAEIAGLTAEAVANLSPADRLRINFLRKLHNTGGRDSPINALLTNDIGNRSAYNYFKVIEQFEVEKSARYEPGTWTYCNIFVWDVTRAMGAEIPHWVIKINNDGRSAMDSNGIFTVERENRKEMLVNETVDWLKQHGETYGWRRIDARMAQQMANEGHPSIAVWENPNPKKFGHIAVIRPGSVGDERGTAISQAGILVLDASHIDKGFKDQDHKKRIQYWYHE